MPQESGTLFLIGAPLGKASGNLVIKELRNKFTVTHQVLVGDAVSHTVTDQLIHISLGDYRLLQAQILLEFLEILFLSL